MTMFFWVYLLVDVEKQSAERTFSSHLHVYRSRIVCDAYLSSWSKTRISGTLDVGWKMGVHVFLTIRFSYLY
jgi:uncharacterized membrane protein (DUF485 family)